MKFDLAKPCELCPFRNDLKRGYLREGRIVDIVRGLFRQESFFCHKTVDYSDLDEEGESRSSVADLNVQACAGAEIFLMKQGTSTQMGRLAERLGVAKKLDEDAPVCGSLEEMLKAHGHEVDEEIEPCAVCDDDCEAPAGYMEGGQIVHGTKSAQYDCEKCLEKVCGNCSQVIDGQRVCNGCAENYDEYE